MSGFSDMLATIGSSAGSGDSSEGTATEETPAAAPPPNEDSADVGEPEETSSEEEAPEGDETEDQEEGPEALKLTIKVDGEEIPLELSDEERNTLIQKGYAFEKKTRELAAERKEHRAEAAALEEYKEGIKQWFGELADPSRALAALQRANVPINDLIEQKAVEMIQEHMASDEEKAQRQAARQRAEYEAFQREKAEYEQQQTAQQEAAAWQERIVRWLPAALESAGLPDDEDFRRAVGRELDAVVSNENRTITKEDFEDAAMAVRERMDKFAAARGETPPKATKEKPPAPPKSGAGRRPARDKSTNGKKSYKMAEYMNNLQRKY